MPTRAGDRFQGSPNNCACFPIETATLIQVQRSRPLGRMDTASPEDFVSHPVSDAGESLLHQEDGLNRRFRFPIQN